MRKLLILAPLMLALSACATKTAKPVEQTFKSPISVTVQEVASWRVRDVRVVIPEALTVSTNPNISLPRDPITWWGEPQGDRKAQVAAIMKRATQEGSAFLRGPKPVFIEVHLARFHALTPKARSRKLAGWHDINFSMFVRDGAGNVLARSGSIDAGFVALQGQEAKEAVAKGQTQKVRINRRVASVVNAWLNSKGAIRGAAAPAPAAAPRRTSAPRATPAAAPAPAPAPSEINIEDVAPDSGGTTTVTSGTVAIANASSGAAAAADECLSVDVRNPRDTDRTGC